MFFFVDKTTDNIFTVITAPFLALVRKLLEFSDWMEKRNIQNDIAHYEQMVKNAVAMKTGNAPLYRKYIKELKAELKAF